jgi:hypothetical protein
MPQVNGLPEPSVHLRCALGGKMKKIAITTSLFLLTLGSLALFVEKRSLGQNQTDQTSIPGNWTFSAHPYLGPDYRSRPIVVTSVGTSLKEMTVTPVILENFSKKTVSSVKLEWILSEESTRAFRIKQGESELLTLAEPLPAKKGLALKQPLFSLKKEGQSLMKDGKLEGKFRLDIAVKEVIYEDGEKWTGNQLVCPLELLGNNGGGEDKKLAHRKSTQGNSCAKQMCKGSNGGYTCGSSETSEYCTNFNSTCCNTICGCNKPCEPGCNGELENHKETNQVLARGY